MTNPRLTVDGVLSIDKPAGLSSFDVIRRVRKALGIRKVGHTGTLDPMATGLLVLVLGQATRLAPFIVEGEKRYRAQITLGVQTTTFDAEGEVTHEASAEAVESVTQEAVQDALPAFRGEIMQRPPTFSAVKVDGKRAYARARRGEDFELPKRSVTIHHLDLLGCQGTEYTVDVWCSKGTYIRSLASDLGEALGVGAHLSGLRRTGVGSFRLDDAVTLGHLVEHPTESLSRALYPMVHAVNHLEPLTLNSREALWLRNGRISDLGILAPGLHRAMGPNDELLAILEVDQNGISAIKRGFPPPSA